MDTNETKNSSRQANDSHSAPQRFDADVILKNEEVQPSYPERRDGWITITALSVIGGAALVSALALLLFPYIFADCSTESVCIPSESPAWASELIKLALVSSLAFVMGTKQA